MTNVGRGVVVPLIDPSPPGESRRLTTDMQVGFRTDCRKLYRASCTVVPIASVRTRPPLAAGVEADANVKKERTANKTQISESLFLNTTLPPEVWARLLKALFSRTASCSGLLHRRAPPKPCWRTFVPYTSGEAAKRKLWNWYRPLAVLLADRVRVIRMLG
jgi:hypothetical protein